MKPISRVINSCTTFCTRKVHSFQGFYAPDLFPHQARKYLKNRLTSHPYFFVRLMMISGYHFHQHWFLMAELPIPQHKKSYKLEQIWQFYRISLLKRKQASTSEEHAVGFEVSFDCFSELSLLVVLSGESPSLSPTFSSESDLLDAGTHLAHSSRLRIFSPYKSTRTSCYDQ